MDPAKRLAITACGRCGQPEDAHKFSSAAGADDLAVFAALGGPCTQYVVSDAAVITQKWLAITDNRAPKRRPDGSIGKRLPLHSACGHRHPRGPGPYQAGQSGPGPDTAARGAAKAREAQRRPARRSEGPRGARPHPARPGGVMTDTRERAIDTLERLIREGQENDSYPRAVAAECLTVLEGQGWRPTEARPAADWRQHGTGTDPSRVPEVAALREKLAAMPPLPEHRSEHGGAP